MRSFFVVVFLGVSLGGCEPAPSASRFGSDLHEHPAHCGLADYQWVDDPSLGEVLERQEAPTNEVGTLDTYPQPLRSHGLRGVRHMASGVVARAGG